MDPSQKFPFNVSLRHRDQRTDIKYSQVRSFYSDVGSLNIGRGIELWRGTFQSFRPGIGRCFINLDISTAAMIQRGSLIDLCLAIIGQEDPKCLSPGSLPPRERQRLKQSLVNVRIIVPSAGATGPQKRMHSITGLTTLSASELTFTMKDTVGKTATTTVAKYCEMKGGKLRFPKNICVEVITRTGLLYHAYCAKPGPKQDLHPPGVGRSSSRADQTPADPRRQDRRHCQVCHEETCRALYRDRAGTRRALN